MIKELPLWELSLLEGTTEEKPETHPYLIGYLLGGYQLSRKEHPEPSIPFLVSFSLPPTSRFV
jgi:hypothetical protein